MKLNLESFLSNKYCEEEFLHLFRKYWIFVGMQDEISDPGSYKLVKFNSQSFILKNEASGPRLYANVCPHRGSEIVKCSGTGKLKCPYHGWMFGAEGKVFVNKKSTFEGLPEDLSLTSFRTELVGKFIFATDSANIISIKDYLGKFYDYLLFVSSNLVNRIDKNSMEIEAHWRIVVENTLESYHVGDVHQDSLAPYFAGVSHSNIEELHSEVVEELTPTMTNNLKRVQSSFFEEHEFNQYRHVHIFPNLTIASSGFTNFFIQEFLPISSNRSLFVSHGFLPAFKEKVSSPVRKTFSETSKNFNRQVFDEDKTVCESVQRGYEASGRKEIEIHFNSFEARVKNFASVIQRLTF